MRYEYDYFHDFRCKCGACRQSCCEGWRVSVSMEEYFKFLGMDVSEELRYKMDVAFMPPENPNPAVFRYLKPNYFGRCPFHDEEGLCHLQRECGELSIPEVCRLFPRCVKEEEKETRICCSCGCEAVVEMLLMSAERGETGLCLTMDAEDEEETILAQVVRCLIAERPLAESMEAVLLLLGGKKQLTPETAFCLFRELIEDVELEDSVIEEFIRRGTDRDIPAVLHGGAKADARVRNLLLNHVVYLDYPAADDRVPPDYVGIGLYTLYCILLAVEEWYENEAEKVDCFTSIFRQAEHAAYYYNAAAVYTRNAEKFTKKP